MPPKKTSKVFISMGISEIFICVEGVYMESNSIHRYRWPISYRSRSD